MNRDWTVIDGLQYSNWSREIFNQMREGGLNAVHVTIAYHENTRETLSRFGEWNQRFETFNDLIRPIFQPQDIALAKQEGYYFGRSELLANRGRDSVSWRHAQAWVNDYAVNLQQSKSFGVWLLRGGGQWYYSFW